MWPESVFARFLWTRGISARSAVASIIIQILQQRPDILYKRTSPFYLKKFKAANTSFTSLWPVLLELLRVIPGILLLVPICSVGDEEMVFVHNFVKLLQGWDGPAINLALFHPKHEGFTKAANIIDLDDKYDVPPSLETTDALHHVVLHELGVHKELSPTMAISLWENMWRSVRYSLVDITLTTNLCDINLVIANIVDEENQKSCGVLDSEILAVWAASTMRWLTRLETKRTFRPLIQAQLLTVPLHLPDSIRKRLQQKARDTIEKSLALRSPGTEIDVTLAIEQKNNHDKAQWEFHALDATFRDAIWSRMTPTLVTASRFAFSPCFHIGLKKSLESFVTLAKSRKIAGRIVLDSTVGISKSPSIFPELDDVPSSLESEVFGSESWTCASVETATVLVEGVASAIEVGLGATVEALKGV
jgi:hypothetical protein